MLRHLMRTILVFLPVVFTFFFCPVWAEDKNGLLTFKLAYQLAEAGADGQEPIEETVNFYISEEDISYEYKGKNYKAQHIVIEQEDKVRLKFKARIDRPVPIPEEFSCCWKIGREKNFTGKVNWFPILRQTITNHLFFITGKKIELSP